MKTVLATTPEEGSSPIVSNYMVWYTSLRMSVSVFTMENLHAGQLIDAYISSICVV